MTVAEIADELTLQNRYEPAACFAAVRSVVMPSLERQALSLAVLGVIMRRLDREYRQSMNEG